MSTKWFVARPDSPRSSNGGNNSSPATPRVAQEVGGPVQIRGSGNSLKTSGAPQKISSEVNSRDEDDDGDATTSSLEQPRAVEASTANLFDVKGNLRDSYGYIVPEKMQQAYIQWRKRTANETQQRGEKFAHINDSLRFAYFDTELQTLFKEGVPTHMRRRLWLQITGVGSKIANSNALYQRILADAERDKSAEFYKERVPIDLDIDRTFGENCQFNTPESVAKLRNVMLAYAKHNRHFGYAQSMNYIILALLLLNFTEEEAFWMLDHLMLLMPDCYDKEFSGIAADLDVLDYYIEAKLPKLYAFFRKYGVDKEMCLMPMFMCLYVGYVPYETMFCLWDRIMYGGIVELFRSALKFLNFIQPRILCKIGTENVTIANAIIEEHQALINPHEALAVMPGSQPLEAGQLQFRRMRQREHNRLKKQELQTLMNLSSSSTTTTTKVITSEKKENQTEVELGSDPQLFTDIDELAQTTQK